MNELFKEIEGFETHLMAAESARDKAVSKLSRILELDGDLSQYKDVGTISQETEKKNQFEKKLQQIEDKKAKTDLALAKLYPEIQNLEIEIKQLSETFEGDAELVCNEVGVRLDKHKKLQQNLKLIDSIINKLERNINSVINRLSSQLL